MQFHAGLEWDYIDQTKLKEVETSWAHSKCREAVFSTSNIAVSAFVYNVSVTCIVQHHTTSLA